MEKEPGTWPVTPKRWSRRFAAISGRRRVVNTYCVGASIPGDLLERHKILSDKAASLSWAAQYQESRAARRARRLPSCMACTLTWLTSGRFGLEVVLG